MPHKQHIAWAQVWRTWSLQFPAYNSLKKTQFERRIQLLTYSMVQSPSWEVNLFAASQEIPRISRNPKLHYRTHKRPPPVSILGQPDPVHIPTSHLLGSYPNIIHPSTPRSHQWSLSPRFPHQDPIHPPSLLQLSPLFVQLMHTNCYKIFKQLKSFKIIIVAPKCFGLHKPSSGSSRPVLR